MIRYYLLAQWNKEYSKVNNSFKWNQKSIKSWELVNRLILFEQKYSNIENEPKIVTLIELLMISLFEYDLASRFSIMLLLLRSGNGGGGSGVKLFWLVEIIELSWGAFFLPIELGTPFASINLSDLMIFSDWL